MTTAGRAIAVFVRDLHLFINARLSWTTDVYEQFCAPDSHDD